MILRMILGRLGVAWYLAPFFNLTSNVSRKYVRFRHLLIRGKDTKEHLVVVSKGRSVLICCCVGCHQGDCTLALFIGIK